MHKFCITVVQPAVQGLTVGSVNFRLWVIPW